MKFSPEELNSFSREAAKPFLSLKRLMEIEDRSSARTICLKRVKESADKNWVVDLLCLQFRNGPTAFSAELWQCYEGEGQEGLDEKWPVGSAIFIGEMSEDAMAGILKYLTFSESVLEDMGEVGQVYQSLRDSFKVNVADAAEKMLAASGSQV